MEKNPCRQYNVCERNVVINRRFTDRRRQSIAGYPDVIKNSFVPMLLQYWRRLQVESVQNQTKIRHSWNGSRWQWERVDLLQIGGLTLKKRRILLITSRHNNVQDKWPIKDENTRSKTYFSFCRTTLNFSMCLQFRCERNHVSWSSKFLINRIRFETTCSNTTRIDS